MSTFEELRERVGKLGHSIHNTAWIRLPAAIPVCLGFALEDGDQGVTVAPLTDNAETRIWATPFPNRPEVSQLFGSRDKGCALFDWRYGTRARLRFVGVHEQLHLPFRAKVLPADMLTEREQHLNTIFDDPWPPTDICLRLISTKGPALAAISLELAREVFEALQRNSQELKRIIQMLVETVKSEDYDKVRFTFHTLHGGTDKHIRNVVADLVMISNGLD